MKRQIRINKYKMGTQLKQCEARLKGKNRIGKDECGKIIRIQGLTKKERVREDKSERKLIIFRLRR